MCVPECVCRVPGVVCHGIAVDLVCCRRCHGYSLDVPAQPDGGEVSPAQLADHMGAPVEQVTNLHLVISTCEGHDTAALF